MAEQAEHEPIVRTVSCDAAAVRRVAAMLDVDAAQLIEGAPLPAAWHFILLAGETRRAELRADGFPGFGVPMADFGLPRLLLAGRTVEYRDVVRVGEHLQWHSRVKGVTHKEGASGPMAIVSIEHDLRRDAATQPAIAETQTYILLGLASGPGKPNVSKSPPISTHRKIFAPDDTLLFQYSALGFNSHKIHIDRAWARDVEGLPDLVVNGGLASLLLMEFLRTDLSITPSRTKARHIAPLYAGRPITLTADRDGNMCRARAFDDAGTLAVDMEVEAR